MAPTSAKTDSKTKKSMQTGHEIDAMCTRCKMLLAHTIVAMVGQKVIRVECKTCKSVHAYKTEAQAKRAAARASAKENAQSADGSAAPKKATRTRKSSKARLTQPARVWAPPSTQELSHAQNYKPQQTFHVGDTGVVLKHPTFGNGYIQKLIAPNKIDVLFASGTKILIHTASA